MSDTSGVALVCFIAGLAVMGLVLTFIGNPSLSDIRDAKAVCEKSLPRDQNCVMQFVPSIKR